MNRWSTAFYLALAVASLVPAMLFADPASPNDKPAASDMTVLDNKTPVPGNPPAPGSVEPAGPPAPGSVIAELRGLDKTTARVSGFDAPVGEMVHFGKLDIVVRDCRKRPPEEEPETAAYLLIDETRPPPTQNDKPEVKHLFQGWMFASSPAVSALEHPVYDVWVIDCRTPSGSAGKSG